jgi:hypothetical protein
VSRPLSRLALLAAAAILAAGPAHAQRLEVDPTRASTYLPTAISTRPGELIASELSAVDAASGVERSAEWFVFTGRAGEVITAQVRSDIPTLQVSFRSIRSPLKALAEGPAKDAPLRLVPPEDDTYVMVAHSVGPQRFGKYLLSLGLGDAAPPFEPPKPAPVQVAEAPAPASKPAAPLAEPALPAIPGVARIRAGQTLARPAGKAGAGVETFMFLAGAGDRLRAVVIGTGPIDIRFFTPEGDEMLAVDGESVLDLKAFAPIDGLYFLSVARKDATKPYELALTAKDADLFTASFAESVGYEILDANGAVDHVSCWVEPGRKLRLRDAQGLDTLYAHFGGGAGRLETVRDGRAVAMSWKTRVEGVEMVRTYDGSGQTVRYTPFATRRGAYRKYLCQ